MTEHKQPTTKEEADAWERAFHEGRQALAKGVRYTANPYDSNQPDLRYQWSYGWLDAEKAYEAYFREAYLKEDQ